MVKLLTVLALAAACAVCVLGQKAPEIVLHCAEYSKENSKECVKCEDRYYLKQPDPKHILDKPYCESCSPGCLKCSDSIGCHQCDSRYTQKPAAQNARCILCDSNCKTCGSEPEFCTSCPLLGSLDRSQGKCNWTFRIIIGALALVALILLVVACISCTANNQQRQRNNQESKMINEKILDEDCTPNKENLIVSVNMIGLGGQNETNLSEVDRITEEPYSRTEDFGGLVSHRNKNNHWNDGRHKLV